VDAPYAAHQHIPLLYILEGVYTNVKDSHEAEDLNPMQKIGWEELINRFVDLLNPIATVGNFCKVLCPELACICQCIPNLHLATGGKTLSFVKGSIILQITDIFPQPLFHQAEAQKQNLLMMN